MGAREDVRRQTPDAREDVRRQTPDASPAKADAVQGPSDLTSGVLRLASSARLASFLALALLFSGCADQLRNAAPTTLLSAAPPPRAEPTPTATTPAPLSLTSEQPLPHWLEDAVRLFNEVTGANVQLPATAATAAGVQGTTTDHRPPTNDKQPSPERLNARPGTREAGGARPSREEAEDESASAPGELRWVGAAEARALAKAGEVAPLPDDLAARLSPELTEQSYAAFEQADHHWGVPLAASWFGLLCDPEAFPDGTRAGPPLFLEEWIDQLHQLRDTAREESTPSAAPLWVAWDEPGCADTFALFVAAMGGRLLDERGLPVFGSEGNAGAQALELMRRLLDDGLVPKNALETHAADLPAALDHRHAFWLGWSEALEAALSGSERRSVLRRLGQLQPAAVPVDRKIYGYESHPAILLVRYRGLVVSAGPERETAWRLARFLADPLLLNGSGALVPVTRAPLPPSGSFAVHSHALLANARQLARWELTPEQAAVLGRYLQAALKKTLTPEEALARAAHALGAPEPPAPGTEASPAGGHG